MATSKASTACLVGSTGLVGSHILTTLAAHPEISSVYAYTRRDNLPATTSVKPASSPKVRYISNIDTSAWHSQYPSNARVFFSALGTTARRAGSFANQRKIDYDLNVALAQAAKNAGATVYVLISTSGASVSSIWPYSRMKGELDEAVKKIGFEHTIILKPGLLVGMREDSRPGEFAARTVAGALGKVSGGWLTDGWAQDADVVARAAVVAGLQAVAGESKKGSRELGQKEIVRLGRQT
ncbi:Protein fmp52, mitochondrial [Cyphellophora attinorum]|uniref:Protein fmp52, mitochondrial n=1 Tax=Cyphellophora attinorum TaxID=1664694 RepID=A0A0N1HE38_9EURO|nr:Protein fmp52, mitochondrial [Phialophora attinorum]KPI43110.1 Protein fmp52, mitochondrial [Phialophora attinorum]